MVQHLTYPAESDEIKEGQTVMFCLQGVCQPIYGRVLEKGAVESRVMTFAYRELWLIPNCDMARRVLTQRDLRVMITQYSPARWG